MKKLLSVFAVAALVVLASCSNNKYSITVTWDVPDANGADVTLTDVNTGDTITKTKVENSFVRIEGEVDSLELVKMRVGEDGVLLILEPGAELSINPKTLEVSGTGLCENLNKFRKAESQEYATDEEYVNLYKKTYEENRDNPLGVYAFSRYVVNAGFDYAELSKLVAEAPENYAQNPKVKMYLEYAKKAETTKEGSKYVDFSIKQPDGAVKKLSDYVGKDGNYLIVDFWASWCPPCRREIETTLKEIYKRYNGKGVTVLGVAVRDEVADTKAAIADLQIPWDIIFDAQKVPYDIYGFVGIPHIMIIAPDGTILSRGLQGEDLAKKVDEIMAKK